MNHNQRSHVEKYEFQEMASCPEKMLLLHQRFLINKIARERNLKLIESWEGTLHGAQCMFYITTHQVYSLKEVLRLFSIRKEMPHFMFQDVFAVEQLPFLGLVTRALRPDVIFQSNDPHRLFFIAGLEHITQIASTIINKKHSLQPIRDLQQRYKGRQQKTGPASTRRYPHGLAGGNKCVHGGDEKDLK